MELQLGLALSSTPTAPPPIKGFDLNNFVDEARVCGSISDKYKKRSFAQAFDDDGEHDKIGSTTSATAVPRTLPLLLWNSEPNGCDDEEDDNNPNKRQHTNSIFTVVIKNDGDGLVGWPPIKSWRKEICFHHHHNNRCGGNRTAGNINGCGDGGRSGSSSNSNQYYYNSTFVKVKMEGVGIARKIDLSLHQSFQTLIDTLMDMFDKCTYMRVPRCPFASSCFEKRSSPDFFRQDYWIKSDEFEQLQTHLPRQRGRLAISSRCSLEKLYPVSATSQIG